MYSCSPVGYFTAVVVAISYKALEELQHMRLCVVVVRCSLLCLSMFCGVPACSAAVRSNASTFMHPKLARPQLYILPHSVCVQNADRKGGTRLRPSAEWIRRTQHLTR